MKNRFAAVLVVIGIIVVGIGIVKYNGIIEQEVAVKKAWAPLLIKLKERYSPIPRMIVEITAYAGQKPPLAKELESNKEQVQTISSISESVELANEIEIDLVKMVQWIKERYPGIINRHPIQVMVDNLAGTEEVLGPDMKLFNEAAANYNAYAQRFPNNLVAMTLGYPTTYSYFQPRK